MLSVGAWLWGLTHKTPTVHDYRRAARTWGRDYTYSPIDGGRTAKMSGWGYGIRHGDIILLSGGDGFNQDQPYRVTYISYHYDPPDMWQAEVEWVEDAVQRKYYRDFFKESK